MVRAKQTARLSSAGLPPRRRQQLLSSDSSSSDSSFSDSSSSPQLYPESDASPTTHGVDASPNTHVVDASPNTRGVDASPQTSPTTPGTDASLMERVANRPRTCRPGPMALSEIRPMRRQTAIVKANIRFENFVDRLVHEFAEDVQRHVRKFYLGLRLNVPLQLPPPCLEIREEIAVSVVGDKILQAFYDKRKTNTPKDRQLARRIRGKRF